MTGDQAVSNKMSVWGPTMRRTRGWVVSAAAVALLATACQSSPAATVSNRGQGGASSSAPAQPFAATVTPADQATGVRPGTPVVVTARTGRIAVVRVSDTDGAVLAGTLSSDGRRWSSTDPIQVGQTYRVTVTGRNAAATPTTVSTSFRSLEPTKVMGARIAPLAGTTMGVGQPIVIYLTAPVTDRAAVQRALEVQSSPHVVGAWHWYSDTEVHFRPREYWPAGTSVTLKANFAGVDAGNGVWGERNREVKFRIGPSMVSTVDVKAHTLTVRRNGRVLKVIPVSTGKDGFLTRNGIKVITQMSKHLVMDSATIGIPKGNPDYYRLDVYWAMRVTNSGEFVHAAPWSTKEQGLTNVSHGCVGMGTDSAKWLFDLTHPGDIVQVINSPRKLESGNGWTDWNMSWSDWVAGSALPVPASVSATVTPSAFATGPTAAPTPAGSATPARAATTPSGATVPSAGSTR